ncbi:TIGR02206 family membrane protein [Alkalihalophilus lindianensis]|uniref:TIGR02206 family membrane protein n=1 Tax=Alkalihalophilus lindianensis TaxID=1630542 RepID=A0ABU3X6R0_9BACI|nr:TIGR02206 family membrane protein [Alkalihalophilus lindianensis]MDV2683585.1 TIGR02206 family membrane protein [Alkalihalophilus lindianensis]
MYDKYFAPGHYLDYPIFLSIDHLVVIMIFFILTVWLYIRRNKSYMGTNMRTGLLILLIVSEISLFVWTVSIGTWDIRYNLPFHLCTISLFFCIYMLLTNKKWVFEVVYFFGLAGALQAILTPDLFYGFPHYRFLHFFIAHIGIILSILYMVWVEKYRVTMRSVVKSFVVLNGLAAVVYLINILTGANYMFLAYKPEGASLLDFLGPHPWYILQLELIALAMFTLLYLPFHFTRKSNEKKQGAG